MALVVKDRVKETTSTTGTGTLTLAGAVAKFQSFSVVGDGNTTYYAIESGNGTDWEVGVGTYTASGTTLSRDTILESSNGGTAISLSGTSIVFCTYPAERSVNTADIGTTIQAYDADTAKYTMTTANFTGTLQNGGSNVVVDTDIGSTVQAYDADTAKLDVAQTFTANQTFSNDIAVNGLTVGKGANALSTNTALGVSALASGSLSGTQNTGIGWGSLFSNTTGSPNTAVGYGSLFLNTTGNANTAIGTEALRSNTTASSNTAVGYQALYLTTGGNNTALGRESGDTLTTGSNNTLIGFNAQPSSATVSNEVTIGNDSVTVTRLKGNVGIGTSSPSYSLDVNNVSRVAGLRQAFQTGLYTVDGALSNYSSTNGVYLNGNASGWLRLNGDGTNATYMQVIGSSTGTNPNTIQMYTSSAERMRIDASGNVGIGTSNPSTYGILATVGNINNLASALGAADAATVSVLNNSVGGLGVKASLSMNIAGIGKSVIAGYYAAFNGSNDIGTGIQFGTQTNAAGGTVERMRIDQNGNVGIGTTSPDALLTVNTIASFGDGAVGTPSIAHKGDLNTGLWFPAADTIAASTAGTERMRIDSSGNLLFNSGYGSAATAYGCRAWVLFDGAASPTVNGSGNISSVVQVSSGVYGITLANAMPDINYVISNCGWTTNQNMIAQENDPGTYRTTTYFEVVYETAGGTKVNNTYNSVMVLR
jgi:hypothetical protein